MQLQRLKVRKALLKKGFFEEPCSNHDRFRFYSEDKPTWVYTELPRGSDNKTLQNPLCAVIKRQLLFESSGDLRDFVICTIEKDDYEKIFKDKKST